MMTSSMRSAPTLTELRAPAEVAPTGFVMPAGPEEIDTVALALGLAERTVEFGPIVGDDERGLPSPMRARMRRASRTPVW
jgi:hypothetical protein